MVICTLIPNIIELSGKTKSYGPDKLRWEEAEETEAEENIRLKQYVSLRSKGRHNNSEMAKVKTVKNESDPPLFTGKLLIKFQNFWETQLKLSYEIG